MPKPPPHWLPWLGPLLAAIVGGALGYFWWKADFWNVLIAALACGFLPILGNAIWKWSHRRRD